MEWDIADRSSPNSDLFDDNIEVIKPFGRKSNIVAKKTARELYRDGYRPLGKAVGQQQYLHREPHHERRDQAWPLEGEEFFELNRLFHSDRAAALNADLYLRAMSAGQVTAANLYSQWEKIVEPTEQEAQIMLEIGFRQGHEWKTWIVATKEKRTYTIGTSWKRPYKMLEHLRGDWIHGICKNKGRSGTTDWIVIDFDRHSGVIPATLFLERLRQIRRLLEKEGRTAMLQVNWRNGSLHLWIPARSMTYDHAQSVIASWRKSLPWLEKVEIFPDNLPQVLLPLRPDKILVCDQIVPKVKRNHFRYDKLTKKKKRNAVPAYSCAYVWKWLQNPAMASWEKWEKIVTEACAHEPDLSAPEIEEPASDKPRSRTARKLKKHVRTGPGSFGPLKGRWLQILVDTYINGVRPPDDSIGILEQGIIRHCLIAKGMTADATKSLIKSLRQRLADKSFSDRLVNNEDELDRANEYLLNNPLKYLRDPQHSRDIFMKMEAYCAKIGFDISNPETWRLPEKKTPRLKLRQSATFLGLVSMISMAMNCKIENAKALLEQVAHHALHKHEIAYSLMKKFLETNGIPGTNTRASKVFKILLDSEFLILRHKYYVDLVSGYKHGNFYVLSPMVTKEKEDEEKEVSTVSLPVSFHCTTEDDLEMLKLRYLECREAFHKRLSKLFEKKMAA